MRRHPSGGGIQASFKAYIVMFLTWGQVRHRGGIRVVITTGPFLEGYPNYLTLRQQLVRNIRRMLPQQLCRAMQPVPMPSRLTRLRPAHTRSVRKSALWMAFPSVTSELRRRFADIGYPGSPRHDRPSWSRLAESIPRSTKALRDGLRGLSRAPSLPAAWADDIKEMKEYRDARNAAKDVPHKSESRPEYRIR